MKKYYPILSLLLFGILFNSCIDKKYTVLDDSRKAKDNVLDVDLGVPLLYSSNMTVEETLMRYLGEEKVGAYSDNLIFIRYENIKFPVNAKTILPITAIPLKPMVISFDDPENFNLVSGKWTITKTDTMSLSSILPTGADLESILFNFCLYNAAGNSIFPQAGELTIRFPELKSNGVVKSYTVAVPANGNFTTGGPVINHTLGLAPVGYTENNIIKIEYSLSFTNNPTSGSLTISTNNFNEVDYKTINGYIGSLSFPDNGLNIPVTLFKDVMGMKFEDPQVILDVNNGFGMPLRLTLANVNVTDSSGNIVPVTFTGGSNITDLEHPATNGTANANTNKTYNNSNSNIGSALNKQPSNVALGLTTLANPNGKQTGINYFINDTSNLDINFGIVFPMHGRVFKYSMIDTVAFDYAEFADLGKMIEFRVLIKNGLPADGWLTMTFLDQNNNVVDVIKPKDPLNAGSNDPKIIASAPVSGETASGTSEYRFNLYYDQLAKLAVIKKVAIDLSFRSTDDGSKVIKVLSTNTVMLKIGVRVGVEIEL